MAKMTRNCVADTARSGSALPMMISGDVALLARSCSDRRIAERLVVSERTAHHHVEHIFTKLGVSTRAAAIVVALQRGLIADPLETGSLGV